MPSSSSELLQVCLGDDGVTVGVAEGTPGVDPDAFDVLLTDQADPPRPWVQAPLDELESHVGAAPKVATVLAEVLRTNEQLDVRGGLIVESLAYSMLQHGDVFRVWSESRPLRSHVEVPEPVLYQRLGERLEVTLARPRVHNAFDTSIRDGLLEAFELFEADRDLTELHLRGLGPSFSSGGDLSEFGLARDPVAAHLLRIDQSVASKVHEHSAEVTVHLHGHCLGAGIEIPAFAATVVAAPDTTIRLPELEFGLIPGAGGTASLPRRIGRHRTAYLALTGRQIDARTALAWGLVDEIEMDAQELAGAS